MNDAALVAGIADVLRGVPLPVVVDVGCYDGFHLTMIRDRLGGRGRFLGIEANDIRKVAHAANVEWVRAVVSDHDGKCDWFASAPMTYPGSSSIVRPVPGIGLRYEGIAFAPPRKVPCRTLDAICADAGVASPDCLWLDVQGAELQVLRGATAALASARVVVIEVHHADYQTAPSMDEIAASLPSRFKQHPLTDPDHLFAVADQ